MAKFTKVPFGPNDPIFTGRVIVSVPVSRRLAEKAPASRVPQKVLDELYSEMNESVPRQMGKKDKPRLVKPVAQEVTGSQSRRGRIVTVDLEMMGMTLEEYYAIDDDSTDGKSK